MFLSGHSLAAFFLISLHLVTAAPLPKPTATFEVEVETVRAAVPLVTSTASLERRVIPGDAKCTETIRYRKGHPAQGAIYNKNFALVFDQAFQNGGGGGTQLAVGVYTAPDDSWAGNPGDWICIIRAEPAKFDKVDKIWIPVTDDCGHDLWWQDEKTIAAHVDKNDLDPNTTIRLSRVNFHPPGIPTYQMLIPPKAIPLLDAMVDCFAPDDPALVGISRPDIDLKTWKNVYNVEDRAKDKW